MWWTHSAPRKRTSGPLWVWLCLGWLGLGLGAATWAQPPAAAPDEPSLGQRLSALRPRLKDGPLAGRGIAPSIAYNLEVSERITRSFPHDARALRARAADWLTQAEQGRDPLTAAGGQIVMRGYRSALSESLQGYAIYIPKDYDPDRRYPLMVMLHGGSANGNLFLGVVLGNNMNWKEYGQHLWQTFTPRWSPDWIVVAPDGFGQVMWRFMGEQDVLDVIGDVQRHYAVDSERIVLGGLSNGGVGAYNIGMRHAHRFAAVMAMAGAPSWTQYANAGGTSLEARLLHPLSGLQLSDNAANTDFRFYHGREDGGPMKPEYVKQLMRVLQKRDLPHKSSWYDTGHDILYLVHRHGRIYGDLAGVRRKARPQEVRLVTGDYRAPRQHWLEVTRITGYPRLARLHGTCSAGRIDIRARHVAAFVLHVEDLPVAGGDIVIAVNGHEAYRGPLRALGDRFHLVAANGRFAGGFPAEAQPTKRPGSSGPITDAYFGPMVHVFGTKDPEHREDLEKLARRGARGWPLWLWRLSQPVVPDTAVTPELMAANHLVLYGTPGDNAILDRIADRLPIRVHENRVVAGDREFAGPGLGAKFIYPNPLAQGRYVLVQTAPDLDGVAGGHQLPDFLPDYVIYDRTTVKRRPRLLYDRRRGPLAQGFFDDHWQLAEPQDPAPGHGQGADDVVETREDRPARDGRTGPPAIEPSPGSPAATMTFPAGQAGRAARRIAGRQRGFANYRAAVRLGTWTTDPLARWKVRGGTACLADLARKGVPVQVHESPLPTPVPTPVELLGPVGGIWFRSTHEERPLLMSCELASRLPDLVQILRHHGVRGIDVMSSYRATPRQSYHTMGLGLDLLRFWTLSGLLSVLHHFEETPKEPTCTASAAERDKARALRDIACALAASRRFSTVLTPNYNAGHRDHFHLDARPNDDRVFIR